MDKKQHILNEIKRTAAANGGVARGRMRFEKETGIKYSDWYGRYWARWGDAVLEAGLTPNEVQRAIPETESLLKLIGLIRELGRYPTHGEMRLRERSDLALPSAISRSGSRQVWFQKLLEYCSTHPGHDDVAAICTPLLRADSAVDADDDNDGVETGYVYLALMKVGREKRYKIGKADIVGARTRQIAVSLPEELELIHAISTDDAYGIEGYWHRRFAEKRRGGEWFALTSDDVRAFKRRRFM
jgi:hypothetical protein